MARSDSHPPGSLAYRDGAFINGDAGRPLRILAEYLEPLERFKRLQVHDTVVFFGSSRIFENSPLARFYQDARRVAHLLTAWSRSLPDPGRFVVCSGGGGGIMEAVNRGASEAGGRSIGLNIGLPHEQRPNRFITPELNLEFHYFFMRKLWFSHLARGLVVFPGGFGTLDELMEVLTLSQTRKLARRIPIILYGSEFWRQTVNFEALVQQGLIDQADLSLFQVADTPEAAFEMLREQLPLQAEPCSPSFARSTTTESCIASGASELP